ncbi:SDR family NAD(P)-dependent oxidoreductase [Nesterenkonia halotolerans]|uniref:NAD(P)-dependent dehydrogenase (Short-subunit alcohol dehydrogenase family) n=1 Tax=Nesterenkonia halotolerans TaxID=225325 RepID=A0ABR9J3Y2_9MICC|nr:SDR family oxidoreductase [Nesterenkonia halotolerans]MBE1513703.1 NAD(P)-dependent dehydrogenase (short-subunit alcohol dehydrogenase family) [Nesterenkonia halotolerans]
MDLQLATKRAFISGSTQGIGYAIAGALLREGAEVVINGRDSDRLEQSVQTLRHEVPDANVTGMAADFADPAGVDNLLSSLGSVDILINNVGLFELTPFAEIADTEWTRYFDVNVMSGVRLSRELLPGMLRVGWGRIVFIGSESGVNIPADMLHYGVTKAGVLALSNGLAKLTRGTGVTVNTILGGPTYSDGVARAITDIAQTQGLSPDELKAGIIAGNQTSLLERFIDPEEIANLAVYLASPRSSATNGSAVRADGGVLTTML